MYFAILTCLTYLVQVDVGNFLRLKSCVLYTELENPDQPLINVEVVAHVTRPEFRSSEVNIYHSIFFKLFNNFNSVAKERIIQEETSSSNGLLFVSSC